MNRFAAALRKLRQDAGFPTSYAFYHNNGGKRTFPFTYAYYAKIERGAGLPRAEWLPLLISQLRIPPTAKRQRELSTAYLRDLIGDERAYAALFAPLLRGQAREDGRRGVMKKLLSAQAYHLTPEQFGALVAGEAEYWCYNALVNNRKALAAADIAAAAGLKTAAAAAALKKLARVKLAKAGAGGKWKSPASGRYCVFPRGYRGYAGDLKKLKRHVETAAERRGESVYDAGLVVRTDPAAVDETRRAFHEAVESASASSLSEGAADSAMYVMEARIRRLFPF